MRFHECLRTLRAERKLTQCEVAFKLGITVASYSTYENFREPNYHILIKMADFFNVSLDYLLGRSDNRAYEAREDCSEKTLTESSVEFAEPVAPKIMVDNNLLKSEIARSGKKQWLIAKRIGKSEATLCRMLREPVALEMANKIRAAMVD